MKINVHKSGERVLPQKKGGVIIASNLKRERVVLDANGNEIDMRTKQIIKKAQE